MAPVPVNRVIETMRLMLKHTIGSAITIRTELGAEAGRALCDENQLENAILNLAINARDAMPEGGTLTISTSLSAEKDGLDLDAGDYVCIAVADTGQGMTREVLARATEPFFSTKPFGKGTGLGLAQVYGIARQSGGTLRIESEEGEGTIVRLLLPHAAGELAAEGADGGRGAERAPSGRPGRAPASSSSTTMPTSAPSSPTCSPASATASRRSTAPRRRSPRLPAARRTSSCSISPCPG